MEGLVIQPVRLALGGLRPSWRPAMGQPVQTSPVTPPSAAVTVVPEKPPIVDSALVSFTFDVLGATASGILAYGAASRKNKLSYLFGIMAGVMGFKAVADLNDIRTR
jgi:hypothetical protein